MILWSLLIVATPYIAILTVQKQGQCEDAKRALFFSELTGTCFILLFHSSFETRTSMDIAAENERRSQSPFSM